MMAKKELSFEEAMQRLDEIVKGLEKAVDLLKEAGQAMFDASRQAANASGRMSSRLSPFS